MKPRSPFAAVALAAILAPAMLTAGPSVKLNRPGPGAEYIERLYSLTVTNPDDSSRTG